MIRTGPRLGTGQRTISGDSWLDEGSAILDQDDRITAIEPALARWLGSTCQHAIGERIDCLLKMRLPAQQDEILSTFRQHDQFTSVTLTSDSHAVRLHVARHDLGSTVRVQSVLPARQDIEDAGIGGLEVSSPAGELEVRASAGSTREFAERHLVSRLVHAEGQLERIVQRWPGVIFSQNADLTFSFISPQIKDLTGIEPRRWRRDGNLFWEVVHDADLAEVQQHLRRVASSNAPLTLTYRVRHRDTGAVAYVREQRRAIVSDSGMVVGYEGEWLDVTRQRIAEKRLVAAAWKDTIAVLTMGLAHDFKNLIAGIHSLAESFEAELAAPSNDSTNQPFKESADSFRQGLTLIKENSRNAQHLVQRIVNLHQGHAGQRSYHDLNELVADTAELVRRIVPRRIAMKVDLAQEKLPIYADAVEFRQVFINLTLNAVDAMPERGSLEFRSYRDGDHVCLCVGDNGCGIPERHLATIFDPFFTTKAVDKGSGLGLYNARVFAERHQGEILVESAVVKSQPSQRNSCSVLLRQGQIIHNPPGASQPVGVQSASGTAFTLRLPIADFTEAERKACSPAPRRHTLLIVGQEGECMESTIKTLRQNNYCVVKVNNEQAAVELLRAPEYTFSAVMVLVSAGVNPSSGMLQRIRRETLPLKTILHITGCNEDQLDSELFAHADLVLRDDVPADHALNKLHNLLAK